MKKTFDNKWRTSWDLDDKGVWILDNNKRGTIDGKRWHLYRDEAPETKEGKNRGHWSFTTKKEALTFHSLFLFADHVVKNRRGV